MCVQDCKRCKCYSLLLHAASLSPLFPCCIYVAAAGLSVDTVDALPDLNAYIFRYVIYTCASIHFYSNLNRGGGGGGRRRRSSSSNSSSSST